MLRDFAVPELIWLKVIGVLVLVATIFGAGFYLRGMKADRDIAKITAKHEGERATANALALSSTSDRIDKINVAAKQSLEDVQALNGKLAALAAERKTYVASHPMPANCYPDSVRLQQLEAQRTASNSALSAP
jgi:hypothetical protein